MNDLKQRRKEMNLLEDQVFLNHAAISIWLHEPYQVYRNRMNEVHQRGFAAYDFGEVESINQSVRKKMGQLINCDPNGLALVNSTSDAISQVVCAMDLDRVKGKKIILNESEFTANSVPWQNLAKQYHMKLVVLPEVNDRILLDDYQKVMDDSVEIVAVSSVQFSNGFRINVKELTGMIHDVGAKIMVDAIQHIGALEFDARDYDIDYLATANYKWMMTPMGSGFLYVRPDLLDDFNPLSMVWFGDSDKSTPSHHNYTPYSTARKLDTLASVNALIPSLDKALDIHLSWGKKHVENYLLEITDYVRESFSELEGFTLASPRETRSESSSIISFRYTDEKKLQSLVANLQKNGYVTSYRAGKIRISPHAYNTKDDIDRLIESTRLII